MPLTCFLTFVFVPHFVCIHVMPGRAHSTLTLELMNTKPAATSVSCLPHYSIMRLTDIFTAVSVILLALLTANFLQIKYQISKHYNRVATK